MGRRTRPRILRRKPRCFRAVSAAALFSLLLSPASVFAEASEENGRLAEGQYTLALVPPIGERTETRQIARTALRRIPEIQGIPFRYIESPKELSNYHAAVLAEAPSNAELTPEWTNAFYSFVEHGGVLLVPGLPGSDLYSLLGLRQVVSSRSRQRIRFILDDPLLAYVDHPNERTISIGNGHGQVYNQVIWSHGAAPAGAAEALARFDDGSGALVRNYYGRGIAYYLGVSFEETVLLPQAGGDFEAQRKFVNSVEPSADTIQLLVKALYEEGVPVPVTISAIPQGRPTALILTHDVDAQTSFVDSLKFARLEEEFGVKSTFFINTKYFKDWMDIAYYSVPENLDAVKELHRRGHEIGSHTVAHSPDFDKAPAGSPSVSHADYRPWRHITINGEVRVSKELLEKNIPGSTVVSFRSGDLAYPPELIGVLESAGYKYDSTFSANDILTTFPYFAFRERHPGAEESTVIEIPVTLDDSLGFLTEEAKEQAVRTWKEIIRAHAANQTITVLLVHPSDTRSRTYKLDAQRELMQYARSVGAWMGDIGEYGGFWRARHRLRISSVTRSGDTLSIRLNLPSSEIHPWAALVLPAALQTGRIEVLDAGGRILSHSSRTAGGKTFVSVER